MPGSRSVAIAGCLRIDAGRSASRRPTDAKALWQRWLDRAPAPGASSDAVHLTVKHAVEPGPPLFTLSDPQGTVEMTLGPGTYEITVATGSCRRRYTVTLDAGATVDLNLADATRTE